MATANGPSHPQDHHEYQTIYGGRLLPQVLDTWAAEDPNYVVGKMAKSDSNTVPLDFVNLSVSQLANAVNYASHWLNRTLNAKPKDTSETIAFIGLQDHRYWVMYYACMKTGRRLLMPSPRNALPNNVSLLKTTECKVLFHTGPLVSQAEALQKLVSDLRISSLPSLEEMTASKVEHYPYTKTWAEAKDDVVMIVHTSGSTGSPKPIYYTNAYLRRIDCDILTPPVEGRELANTALCKRGKNLFIGSTFFHLSGILVALSAIFRRFTVVCGPADQLTSGRIVAQVVRSVPIDGMILVPSICDSVFGDHGEELLPHLSGLEHVCWLGGIYFPAPF
jgi:acyl-CoA synthetase (AMP-forming)/AMP-acid ligase II